MQGRLNACLGLVRQASFMGKMTDYAVAEARKGLLVAVGVEKLISGGLH